MLGKQHSKSDAEPLWWTEIPPQAGKGIKKVKYFTKTRYKLLNMMHKNYLGTENCHWSFIAVASLCLVTVFAVTADTRTTSWTGHIIYCLVRSVWAPIVVLLIMSLAEGTLELNNEVFT